MIEQRAESMAQRVWISEGRRKKVRRQEGDQNEKRAFGSLQKLK
jgi:hypothetical protein